MPSPSDAAALQLILADLARLTIRDLMELWRRYSDNPDIRGILEVALPEVVAPYAAGAAAVSAQWYDELVPGLDFTAEPDVDLPAARFANTIGWALNAPGRATPLDRLAGSSQRMLFDTSRHTILTNLEAEYGTVESEPGTRWARYASSTACSFCRILATRGAVFRSADSAVQVSGRSLDLTVADRRAVASGQATVDELLERRETYARGSRKGQRKNRNLRGTRSHGSKYHDHCRCIAVPVRPGDSYEPPSYVEKWQKDYQDAFDAVPDGTPYSGNNVLKAVIRNMDAANK